MSEDKAIYQKLLDFLDELDRKHIYFELTRVREEAIMVRISVPGERWEVEFMNDGTIETEVFQSTGGVKSGAKLLERLFREFSD